jgi:hypothetical protein
VVENVIARSGCLGCSGLSPEASEAFVLCVVRNIVVHQDLEIGDATATVRLGYSSLLVASVSRARLQSESGRLAVRSLGLYFSSKGCYCSAFVYHMLTYLP